MARNGDGYIWHRPEFMERLNELATFGECGAAAGRDITKSIAKWRIQYPDFPEVVCQADHRVTAKKYLVKSEFAAWLLKHETEILDRETLLYERLKADMQRVKKRIDEKRADIRIAKDLKEKWPQTE